MPPSTIVVTGAAGFVGLHVVEALLRRGNRVVGIDNFDPFYDRASKEQNLATERKARAERLPPQEGDIEQTWADISLARSKLGFEPAKQLADGIRGFVAWWKATYGERGGPCAAS